MSKRASSRKAGMIGASMIGLAVSSAMGSIFQTASPYTDTHSDQVGSTNLLRDIWGATITNDATNLYITIDFNPSANLATGGAFNYGVGITTGPGAGGDTSANATTHGNPYTRTLSIDSSLGGMTDWIGIFGAGGSGSTAAPYTSYGFNDYTFSSATTTWTKIDTVTSGGPIVQGSGPTDSSISVTVPIADFANLTLTPGTTIDFDIYSTGTTAGQTAYDSLADQSATNATNNATTQYNGTVLDSYTIASVPEPASLAGFGITSLLLMKRRNQSRR